MGPPNTQIRKARVVEGLALSGDVPVLAEEDIFIPAKERNIYLSDKRVLDSHVLFVGGIGQGKSNGIKHLLRRVQETMGKKDVAVIFDPKGDYLREFRRPEDIVINDPEGKYEGKKDEKTWNLFAELPDVRDEEDREETATEIAHTLFDEALEKTQERFFPMAAMQLVAAILVHPEFMGLPATDCSNQDLVAYWNKSSRNIVDDLQRNDDTKGLARYIGDGTSEQALGVLSEIVQGLKNVFLGRFRKPPTKESPEFSIRKAVRDRGSCCIFIEYRVRAGKAHAALYRILMDLAIKEALSAHLPAEGKSYFFLDELRLLPRLAHLDNGVNFGREFGLRFVAGMQTHAQVKAAYEDEADSILSGFNSIFAYRTTNPETRAFIQGIAGHNKKLHIYNVIPGHPYQDVKEGQVVEDYDVWELDRDKGQALVFLPNREPFIASITEYPKKGAS